ncbi:MAG: tRNA uridine-5-carboxymethylaminomethyl(34) synthesis GTPase MnmE [Clostridiales bacterium]|nr:tRNA uridine-5-carboxymethylaminomethyl(34) synthesis GTPase MnmE [Clostridiales bacterium]
MNLDDWIAAIATPAGSGGIGIVRVSGNGCIDQCDLIFRSKKGKKLSQQKSHTIIYGTIIDPKTGKDVDEALVSVMRAPNTYTKEDIVEINCHGGTLVTQKVLESVLNTGIRLAEPGEFTKRAFLNGRIDLSQAEAVMDLINAKTDLSRESAIGQLEGALKQEVRSFRQEVLDMIASIEAVIDYPEHDIEEETYEVMEQRTKSLLTKTEILLANADKGKMIREGIQAVILGKPNVGKSSLLNYLLEEDRAIVTDIPGTTRDTVEEFVNIAGIPVKIIDTAGIHKTTDIVEKIGVEKSKEYARKADLLLLMLDGSRSMDEEDREILQLATVKKTIILINKMDLNKKLNIEEIENFSGIKDIIPVSIKTNQGMDQLENCLKKLFFEGEIEINGDVFAGNTRHRNCLYQAKLALEHTLQTIITRMPEDFISMDLQDVNRQLGEITGDSVDDEIIDRIFTKFCLGK